MVKHAIAEIESADIIKSGRSFFTDLAHYTINRKKKKKKNYFIKNPAWFGSNFQVSAITPSFL